MLEQRGNIFLTECDALCITTNGFTKTNGDAVMGRGCAEAAARYFPHLPALLGKELKQNGNRINNLGDYNGVWLMSFPVKPIAEPFTNDSQVVRHMRGKYRVGQLIPGWACIANLEIIKASARQLVELTNKHKWDTVVLPRPGCGAGELSWDVVKPLLEEILDNRFICMTF